MIGIIIVCVLALMVALMVALIIWFNAKLSGKAWTLMERWASENGLELLHLESRWFRKTLSSGRPNPSGYTTSRCRAKVRRELPTLGVATSGSGH